MITTAQLQSLTRPQLKRVFEALGNDLLIVRPTTTVNADGFDSPGVEVSAIVRGLLLPISTDRRVKLAATGGQLAIPAFEALLPHDAPVTEPGFVIRLAGVNYYPTADAIDEGSQGVLLVVPLAAPGNRG
ncbi:hypothetical protein [Deinococcus peraridilitoris]|uniref:Uncharacterized protein n=1 Tax=Deinococcus peraridilitoris (strain DSM 19664 / LMG 22246 / CIP 109416 / KR-200) TaxID=937777 RepID=L0A2A0_DEIPD|nr:hypothetical protein [Deinococcus peraridilitoris]AFZ67569.1 hypothetical protein Deipe_2073 [Deinococcus peraridilitoris DSM 19664]